MLNADQTIRGPVAESDQSLNVSFPAISRRELLRACNVESESEIAKPINEIAPAPDREVKLPGVEIPSREDILNKPIQELREELEKAFSSLCKVIEPLIPYLKSINFHGTSEGSAEKLIGGADLIENKLWVGSFRDLAPTVELVTRDLLNSIQVAAGFSGRGAGEGHGALLIIRGEPEAEKIAFRSVLDSFVEEDGYLARYLVGDLHEGDLRGAASIRADIGSRFTEPGSLAREIIGVINWKDSPYTMAPEMESERKSLIKQARALHVLADLLTGPNRSELVSDKPINREILDDAVNGSHLIEEPNGALVDRYRTNKLRVIIGDRIYVAPKDPMEFGEYIGRRFNSINEDAAKLIKLTFPDDRIPAEAVVGMAESWIALGRTAESDFRKIAESLLTQYAEHLNKWQGTNEETTSASSDELTPENRN